MTSRKLLVVDVVGLTPRHLRDAPGLSALAGEGFVAPLTPSLPAVTCTVQSSILTGKPPSETGIVGNGWYFRELSEVWFWRQSNALVEGEKLWETARKRKPGLTAAKMFWWYNMYSSADWSVTPRPGYPADGRKIPDVYAQPPVLRTRLNSKLGSFPLFKFWGPATDISSTRWIVDSCLDTLQQQSPDILLAYLPHLDYNLQRVGPDHPDVARDVREVDAEACRLIKAARDRDYDVVVLSEYGITPVERPIHPNRLLREAGFVRTWKVLDQWEILDCGACEAFAVADHQLAHVYVKDPGKIAKVAKVFEGVPGIARVLVGEERAEVHLDHARAGELVLVAEPSAWFTYYFWFDDALAPDYARTVDIHRKPGYDPVELFLDPARPLVKGRLAFRLLQKILGFRYLMDVIPLDASLVKGSHGAPPPSDDQGPLVLSPDSRLARDRFKDVELKDWLLERMGLPG